MKLRTDFQIPDILVEVGKIADKHNVEVYAVGGYVRDLLLEKKSKDIDFVVVGDGIKFAKLVKKELNGSHIVVYNRFGTANVGLEDIELEFVGARSETYSPSSRKPIVEAADLNSDLSRRDFTINAIALGIRAQDLGTLIDPFNGKEDLVNGIIKTPLEPKLTFHDDPLRILRAIRFSTRFNYEIEPETFDGILQTVDRLPVVSFERITNELNKTFSTDSEFKAMNLLNSTKIKQLLFPEITNEIWIKSEQELSNFKEPSFINLLTLFAINQNFSQEEIKRISKKFKLSNNEQSFIFIRKKFSQINFSNWNEIEQRLFLFGAGHLYKEIISFLFERLNVLVDSVLKQLSILDKDCSISNFKLAIDGKQIQKFSNLPQGKELGELKDLLIENVLKKKLVNEPEQLKSFVENHANN